MSSVTGFSGDGSGYQYLTPQQQETFEQLAVAVQNEYSRRVASGEPWVLPEVALAQIGVETAYNPDYMPGYMCFGVKAGPEIPEENRQYLLTTEYDAYGNPYQTTAAFRKYNSYEESISDYFDMLATAGYYDGAIRNPNAYDAFNIICPVYATGPEYLNSCLSMAETYNLAQFNNTVSVNSLSKNTSSATSQSSQSKGTVYICNMNGYNNGCNDYSKLKDLMDSLNQEVNTCIENIKRVSDSQPILEYKTFTDFSNMVRIVETLEDLLKKTKNIADVEKEIAEAYDKSDGSTSSLQLSKLAIGAKDYSFDASLINYSDLLKSYKETGSDSVFSDWFSEYISEKGIESKVIDMTEYTQAIKGTGAVKADDYIVSKVGEYIESTVDYKVGNNKNNNYYSEDEQKGIAETVKDNKYNKDNKDVKLSMGEDIGDKFKDKSDKGEENIITQEQPQKEEVVTPPTQEVVTEQPIQSQSPVYNNITVAPPVENDNNVSSLDDSLVNNLEEDPVVEELDDKKNEEIPVLEEEDNVVTTINPNDSQITRIPPVDDKEVKKTNNKSGISGLVTAGLGIGAVTAAGIGGAYYLRKKTDSSLNEEGSDYDDDEEGYGLYEDNGSVDYTQYNTDSAPVESYKARSNVDVEGGNDNGYQYDLEDNDEENPTEDRND